VKDFDGYYDEIHSVLVQLDGKIVVAGHTNTVCALVRYNPDGSEDDTFGQNGVVLLNFGIVEQATYSLLLQPDGKLISAGGGSSLSDTDSTFELARLDTNGQLDPTFGVGGKVVTDFGFINSFALAALVQPYGKIVAAGLRETSSHRWVDVALARYLGN
jgi:uncharacterized delta-60 repeat protein